MKCTIAGLGLALVLHACSVTEMTSQQQPQNADAIEQLIQQLTIEEKVGQMTQINLDVICEGGIYKLVEPHHVDTSKLRTAIETWHVGSVLNCGGHAYPLNQWHQLIQPIHAMTANVAVQSKRPWIPVLYGVDAIHGANYMMGSVLFPQPLAQAASFNPALIENGARITAYETRAAGIPWNFSPVLDVARNPNWSRCFETYGEDTYVCSVLGRACIRGYQGGTQTPDRFHVAACMKHFLGYSGARTGKDRTPAIISDIELRQIYLPSFQAAIQEGALSVMINSGEINGIPVHANPVILTQLLRDELKFDGVAVTDWEDVMKLHQIHHVSPDMKTSVLIAVQAGIDLCMVPNDFEFAKYLIELVKEGKVSEERLNVSVRRILLMKQRLGLFDQQSLRVPADQAKAFGEFGGASHQQAALDAAVQSMTLLKNSNATLPFSKTTRVMVTGPAANSRIMLNGAWSRTWQGVDSTYESTSQQTIFSALKKQMGEAVSYAMGVSLDGDFAPTDALDAALKNCDVVVACVGELPSTEKPGDIEELTISAGQRDLVKYCASRGKKVVLVLVEGRPRIIHDIVPVCDAILLAYQPGSMGGDAIAGTLTGAFIPSGRLPMTYPAHEQSLLTYDHKHTEQLDTRFGMSAYQPEWPFGFGLSYASFTYSPMRISNEQLGANDSLVVEVDVKNTSFVSADHTVMVYSHDQVASITPSVKKLRAFERKRVNAGSTTTYRFVIHPRDLAFVNAAQRWVTEPGAFDILIEDQIKTIQYKP